MKTDEKPIFKTAKTKIETLVRPASRDVSQEEIARRPAPDPNGREEKNVRK